MNLSPPDSPPLDPRDAAAAIDLFQQAGDALQTDDKRHGSTIRLPEQGRLLMTGDLHDHAPHFAKCITMAKLDASPDHHVILHELIHGRSVIQGVDLSIRLQLEFCRWKVAFPRQVHGMLANHDLAQVRHASILKAGQSVTEAFEQGVEYLYGDDVDDVLDAYEAFVLKLPLAVICANGVMCSHSLPSPRMMEHFDTAVLERTPTDADYDRGGSAYAMAWGRHQDEATTDTLAQTWNVEQFCCGHQPTEAGWFTPTSRMLVLDSQHGRGMALPIDLSQRYTQDDLVAALTPLAAVS